MAVVRVPESCKVYTPACLADAMVKAMDHSSANSWLEPSVGEGAFLNALARVGVKKQDVTALDLDATCHPADKQASVMRGVDFLKWSADCPQEFDRIIANPPYMAISRLPRELQSTAAIVRDLDDTAIGLGSNTWYAFMCAALRLLRDDGNLGFVLPSSWHYAQYASMLRQRLPCMFESVVVHRCKSPLFPEVQEGTTVLLAKGYRLSPTRYTCREHDGFTELVGAIDAEEKLTVHNSRAATSGMTVGQINDCILLEDILQIRLGAVTGDSKYFLLTEYQRADLDLPTSVMMPVLSRCRHLRSSETDKADWTSLLKAGERVWLFHPKDVDLEIPSVASYIKRGRSDGLCNIDAFKIRNREPWYTVNLPKKFHGFMSGMSRTGPWISFNRYSKLTASNTLYTVRLLKGRSHEERCAYALTLLTSPFRRQLSLATRTYADGLAKYEPSDILNLKVPIPPLGRAGASQTYQLAVDLLVQGKYSASERVADEFVYGLR